MDHKMIKANRDETVLIKEAAKYHIHVRLSTTNFNPNDPTIQSTRSVIQVYTPEEYKKMEAMRNGKHPMIWYRVAGFKEAKVVHDGRLVPKEKAPEESPPQDVLDEKVKAEIKKQTNEAIDKKRKVANVKKSFASRTDKAR